MGFFLIEKRKGLFCIGLVDFACKVEMDEGSNCSVQPEFLCDF